MKCPMDTRQRETWSSVLVVIDSPAFSVLEKRRMLCKRKTKNTLDDAAMKGFSLKHNWIH